MSSSEENETVSQQKQLKEQLVSLNREELLRLRSTPGHYECVRLLKIGCPESYEELLSLLQDLAGDVNSKSSVNLENNKRKVQLISDGLQKSEVFHRQGDWKTAYKARESLALCFSEHDEDIDLAKHFFISCLTMCLEQPDSERKTRAFVYQNLGLLDERAGNFQSALTHLETAAELAKTVPCMGKGGKTLLYREIAGQCHQVCLTLGSLVKKGDASGPLFYYYKALDHALVAKDKKAEAKAHYKISLEYLEEGMNYQLAEEHLKKYKKLCQETDDLEGLCQAHHGLATIQERQGNRGAALKVLKECLKKTEELDESKSLEMLAISNVKLGILYTSMELQLSAI
ncbi:tetratricopeptide repeat protein 29-like [Limulus polyphemus]|uniref:MAU2 chromatid cohesion factor homolog n=1 Tax=Limulus polyphemus TaxID=6850 RepID=A0ABM1BLF7_LIMPO|nr:tetratricopeptide repeat protein 29-like [Limulus polyphemus]